MNQTCQIKWIDDAGKATPDQNPSIGRVHLPARVVQVAGRGVRFDASDHYHICAEHAARLRETGMELWIFEPIA